MEYETMKKTKIWLSLVLCVLMVVSMFGCTGGNGGNTEAPETTETPGTTADVETTAEGKQATVYYDDYLTAIDNFYIEMRNEYMADYHNITSSVILNELFKNKC